MFTEYNVSLAWYSMGQILLDIRKSKIQLKLVFS